MSGQRRVGPRGRHTGRAGRRQTAVTNRLRGFCALYSLAGSVCVLACGIGYVQVQQVLRSAANDPQVQIAEDAAAALDAGRTPLSVVSGPAVDIGRSLAPWIAVYDTAGAVLAS